MSDTRAPKKRGRRWPWVLVAIPLLVLAGLGWLVETESGLIAIARVASGMSAGRLSIEAPRGSFAGPLRLASLRWRDAVDDVLLQGIAIDWRLSGLVRRERPTLVDSRSRRTMERSRNAIGVLHQVAAWCWYACLICSCEKYNKEGALRARRDGNLW